MIKVNVKTLWNGRAGISERYLHYARTAKEDLEIHVNNAIMLIPYKEITHRIVGKSQQRFIDKFGGDPYYLYYFRWESKLTPSEIMQSELFSMV